MSLTVLSVGFPFAAVGRDASGGAEQILATLDRAIVASGATSIVIAPEGSQVAGELVPIPLAEGPVTDEVRYAGSAATRAAIVSVMNSRPIDMIHAHGVDFFDYIPPPGPPLLVTLHLPPDWYPERAIRPSRPDTWLVPVSHSQASRCMSSHALLAPIENGIPVGSFQARHARRDFALVLARICPEKGIHLALEAAHRAGVSCVVAGELFPYPDHVAYFEKEVRPWLDEKRRWIGPVGFARKRRLLTAARCVLVASLCEETSSLVAREAMACGTPVIAFARGALPEAVEHGRTGFLVDDAAGMAEAIAAVRAISPDECRRVAYERFDERVMTERYLSLYRQLVRRPDSGAA
jgi:glycosyltransferase involved in cell wall biosynthesis